MCARYTLSGPIQPFAELFDLDLLLDLTSRFNIAPTQEAPIIRFGEDGKPEIVYAKWGLIPSWAKDPKVGAKHLNARSETIDEKPSFRDSIIWRRCLIPATGFFEWETEPGGRKQPYFIHRPEKAPFAFAGIWDRWIGSDGVAVESYSILTTSANESLRHLHERMPVILTNAADGHFWLNKRHRHLPDLRGLMVGLPVGALEMYPVTPKMNSAAFDEPEAVEHYERPTEMRQLSLFDIPG